MIVRNIKQYVFCILFFYFYNTNQYNGLLIEIKVMILSKIAFRSDQYTMGDLLLKHKTLIFFISLILIFLFLLIVYLMPDSTKIPSKGVFVFGKTFTYRINTTA